MVNIMYNTRPSRTEMRNKEKFKWKSKKGGLAIGSIASGISITAIIIFAAFTMSIGGGGGEEPTVYGIHIFNTYDHTQYNNATISYYDSNTSNLPDDLIATGNADNVTMLSWDFTSGEIYWCLTQLAGFQDKWSLLDIDAPNNVYIWELPTLNATTTTFLTDLGVNMTRSKNANATLTFFFNYITQEGLGFETFYNASADTYGYVTMNFTFSSTSGLTVDTVQIKNGVEVSSEKALVTTQITVPVTSSFLCGDSGATNQLSFELETSGLGTLGLTLIELIYEGIVYARLAMA